MRRASNNLLNDINLVTEKLTRLTRKLDPETALANEGAILAAAGLANIFVPPLPKENLPRGEMLAVIDQKTRMREAGLVCTGKRLSLSYAVLDDPEKLTELLLDYDDNGAISRAYIRAVDRNENRSSVTLDAALLPGIEELFGPHGLYWEDGIVPNTAPAPGLMRR